MHKQHILVLTLSTTLPCTAVMSPCSYQSFTLFRIQTSPSSMYQPLYIHVSAPILWNSLHHSIRFCESLTTFRKHLKTFYFQSAFSGTPTPVPQIQFFGAL